MKKGFTLIELLVASLLMGMLVTILTMVFNSSSVAWRTGKAGLVQLNDARRQLSASGRLADDALPFVEESGNNFGLVASAWSAGGGSGCSALRKRALILNSGGDALSAERKRVQWINNQSRMSSVLKAQVGSSLQPWASVTGEAGATDSQKAYTIGVWSYGPDGKPNTPDDITTWPEDAK